MTWLLLVGAIASEVVGTISLRYSEGFSKLVPSIVVVIGYVASFVLLAQVLQRGMNIGIAYAVWAALGVSLVALFGAFVLGETLTPVQIGGLLAVIGGVVALELGAASHP